jgi:hypothetical protein
VSTERHGGLPFPAPSPDAGETVGDPGLGILLDCLQTVINSRLAAPWARLRTGSDGAPCRAVRAYDPTDGTFNMNDAPCLFGWRSGGETEQIAEDYRLTRDTVTILWLYPFAVQASSNTRHAFASAVVKVVNEVLKLGRDPSWRVPGDPDAAADQYGSLLWTHAGFWKADGPLRWQRIAVIGTTGDDKLPGAAAVQMTFPVEERLVVVGDDPFRARADLTVGDAAFLTDSLSVP